MELISSGVADRKTAAALLHLLASGLLETADPGYDAELLSGSIRRECSLNKRMADRLAIILYTLYSEDNKREWRSRNLKGFGTVDCHYEARIILRPTGSVSGDKDLTRLLGKNPFATKETIHDLFSKKLRKYLDYEFEDYCTEDDYYQPVVEDFGSNLEYDLQKWSEENGFEFVSCEGDGNDDGYEPKFRKGWY